MEFSTTLTSLSADGSVLYEVFKFLEPFGKVASGLKSLLGLVK